MKSAQASAKAFVRLAKKGDKRAKNALGIKHPRSRAVRNLYRRKSLGGAGG